MTDNRQTFWDKCWKAPNGKQGLAQLPNVPIIVWLAALIVAQLLNGKAQHVAQAVSFGAIFTWAWLELFQGVSYFRRLLGAVVLVVSIMSFAAKL